MGSAKEITLKPIPPADANALVRRVHYSGKVDTRSGVHIGVYYMGSLEGALQFGPSIDKRKTIGLVRGTAWHEYIELNRMAFTDTLPRNSESRALGVAFRILRQHAPQLKWVLSYADATQCGDGTIYRASGFLLTQITENRSMWRLPSGEVICKLVLQPGFSPNSGPGSLKARLGVKAGESSGAYLRRVGAAPVPGYQFRYVRFLDPAWVDRLAVPVIPFEQIPAECRMYRGKRGGPSGPPGDHPGEGGSTPTPPLHLGGGV